MRSKLLVVLQCPWRKGTLQRWHPSLWKREFLTSRTGVRLLGEVIPQNIFKTHFTNTNPSLAECSSGVFPANLAHLRRRIKCIKPNVILACGRVAQKAVWSVGDSIEEGTYVVDIPHPASRTLSHYQTRKARRTLLLCQ